MTTFVPTNQEIGEYDTKHVIQQLQGGTRFRVPAGVLHGEGGAARDGAGRDAGGGGRAGAVGGIRGAGGCHQKSAKPCCNMRNKL